MTFASKALQLQIQNIWQREIVSNMRTKEASKKQIHYYCSTRACDVYTTQWQRQKRIKQEEEEALGIQQPSSCVFG